MKFEETQRFNQWWLWLILIALLLLSVYILISQLYFNIPVGDNPVSDGEVYILLIFCSALIWFFRMIKLYTHIDEIGIYFRLTPFTRRLIRWEDIQSAEVLKYGFVGYGLRLGTGYGTVYNISGNKGLQIILKDKRKILVGTQNEFEMARVVDYFLKLD